ncbi:MAG: tetratricopeptide repeat protein [Patescibacteria group bacterium]
MIFDIIALLIAVASLAVILAVVIRKFPMLSMINEKAVPGDKESKIKNVLLEQRLKRKAVNIGGSVKKSFSPFFQKASEMIKLWYHKIVALEKKYREEKKKTPLTLEEKDEKTEKVKLLLTEAEELFNRDEHKSAENKCIEVLSLDKSNPEAYHRLGDIYLAQKDYEHAKEIFSFLIKFNEKDDRALSGLGLVASSLGNLKEAEEDLLASINYNNKKPSYYLDLARVYQALEQTDKALSCCQEALKLEPKNPKILHNLLQICLEAKNKGLAIRTLDRLKVVNPENKKLDDLKKQIDSL